MTINDLIPTSLKKSPIFSSAERIFQSTTDFIRGNPIVSTASVGAGVTGLVTAVAAVKKSRKKSKSKKKTKKKARKRSTKKRSTKKRAKKRTKKRTKKRNTCKRKRKYARTAGKRRDRSTRRIRMTKNGQPYIILKSGKARFIKKSSAKSSRRRKGGRY